MKTLNQYIQEKLIINKDYHDAMIVVKSFDELRKIIEDRYDKLGPGTEQEPIDFNDIDVSNLDSFCHKDIGIFEETQFKYIDISDWDVSSVTDMSYMFYGCNELTSVGDISKWDVSNVTNMLRMFYNCRSFNQYKYISSWDVSNVTNMCYMFYDCKNFNQDIHDWDVSNVTNMRSMFNGCNIFNQDISNWDVSKVTDMDYMFYKCNTFNQDLSKWNVSKVRYGYTYNIFSYCPIKEEYKPKFKK